MTVRDLLLDESRWIKGVSACDREGNPTSPEGSSACRWCLEGALVRVYGGLSSEPATKLENRIYDMGYVSITDFNDDYRTTHAKVLKLLDEVGI